MLHTLSVVVDLVEESGIGNPLFMSSWAHWGWNEESWKYTTTGIVLYGTCLYQLRRKRDGSFSRCVMRSTLMASGLWLYTVIYIMALTHNSTFYSFQDFSLHDYHVDI
jgi:hypothetical protein